MGNLHTVYPLLQGFTPGTPTSLSLDVLPTAKALCITHKSHGHLARPENFSGLQGVSSKDLAECPSKPPHREQAAAAIPEGWGRRARANPPRWVPGGRGRRREEPRGLCWAVTEVGGAAFGDARWAQCLVPILEGLSEHPTASIPHACGTWARTQATSRFFDNPRVTSAAILAPHRRQTVRRVAAYPILLAVPDTTVFHLTLHRQTQGLGPIGQTGLSGWFLHSCLAISPEGVPPTRKTATAPINTVPWPRKTVAEGLT